jgi:divalent anion:Na+ symporter, DASS family
MTKLFFCILVGILTYYIPKPDILPPEAWRLLAIFVATILGIILRPLPMGAVALIGLCTTIFTNTLNIQTQALTGFSSSVIWLVVIVFFIARGVIKTHLGTRIAYYFVSLFGKSALSLGYVLSLTEVFLAPFIPSNTARAGGIIFPMMKSISETIEGEGTHKKIGSFLMQLGYHTNILTGAMFLTGSSVNSIIQSFAFQQGIQLTWTNWFLAALIPSILSLLTMPLIIYWLDRPTPLLHKHVASLASTKLKELGAITNSEKIMIFIFIGMLTLWVGEPIFKISATTVALLGLCCCLITNILTIDDILSEKEAWNTLLWLATLVTMATYLQKFGLIDWASLYLKQLTMGLTPTMTLGFLSVIYFYAHYFFAGNTAHASAMYPAFLSVCIAAGSPPLLSALLLGFFSSLYACLTHYGTASGPIFFASGYTSVKTWFLTGFVLSLAYMIIWLGAGYIWWKFLGLY